MKRLALAVALAVATITSYYGAPLLFKNALLALNRSLSGLEEQTGDMAMHKIHYLDSDSNTPVLVVSHPGCHGEAGLA